MYVLQPNWVVHPGEKGKKLPIYAVHAQPGGERLATGGQDCKIRIWNTRPILNEAAELDAAEPRLLATLALHTGAVLCLRWNPAGRLLASGADDSKIVIWEEDRSGYRPSAAFGQQGQVASIEAYRAVKVLFGHDSDVADLAWSPNNEYLASCGLDSHVFIWDGKTFDKLKRLDAHQGFVKGITWDPVGKYLATQSDDKSVRIWRTSDWVVEHEIVEPYGQASSTTFFRRLSWSPDGSCIATANGENGNMPIAPIINRDTWGSDVSLVGHQAPIEVAAFNPLTFDIEIPQNDEDEDMGASGSNKVISSVCAIGGQDRGISIWWTARPFSAASTQDVFTHTVLDMSWSSDGFVLYACSYDGTVVALTFNKLEFGVPVSSEDTESSLAKYGFQKVKQAVPETASQLALEDTYKVMKRSGTMLSPSKQPPTTASGSFVSGSASGGQQQEVNILQLGKQKETRTATGKKRITPVLIRSASSPMRQATVHVGPTVPFQPVSSSAINNGSGIAVGAPSKRKAGDLEDNANVVQDTASKHATYVLPTFSSVSPPSRLLALPKVKAKLVTPILIGQQSVPLNLETTNPDTGSKAVARIHGSKSGELQFSVALPSAVLSIAGSQEFWTAACADASVNVFTLAGRRLLPPIVLPSPVSYMSVNGSYLMAILTTCTIYVWDILKQRNLLSNEPVTPLSSKASADSHSLKLMSASIRASDGKPFITLSNGDCFVYHYEMKVWMNVRGFDGASTGRDSGFVENEGGFKVPERGVLGKNGDLLDHAELGMVCSSVLGLSSDYRNWLKVYARKLSDEGIVSKVKELCDELVGELGPKGSDVMGVSKRNLLKEILPILATNRDLQRTVSSYHEYLNSQ
ncbi:WD40 repeat-like protein [Rhizoclosmatium globosum]|uniref:Protein HIR n=1 Tax=Rhizoclosmatium globosum TaxID=329046 RepID=A0A1Y2CYY4_9FUNG|nr:WD40 repeat-like protein [Rhizoclosmatium globosum]|eukprot:ORY52086.1 WD40 repeat-like protein [Rhizoclosmatium globosum]